MIGDHHGRAADTATLLLTTTDGILGTNGSGPGGPVLARGRFYWASLRVARWVAYRCVRVLLCVVPRCSPSVSLLVTLHSCWSVEVPGLHGMQEVSGSSPLSSTQVRDLFRAVRLDPIEAYSSKVQQ